MHGHSITLSDRDSFILSRLGCNRQARFCRSAASVAPGMSIACNTPER
ncbi:protein of unassigned function [Methylobacterium oryzae CBMB20]|uniref:Protein of unassigned function n=1 Tax=Methylobacterium oryzae CBMB20 TaxID=693986 RepID=A0A089P0I2_9HYPH|nr:protein of unassigned function [Methylobacterium oryzae CBMB20]